MADQLNGLALKEQDPGRKAELSRLAQLNRHFAQEPGQSRRQGQQNAALAASEPAQTSAEPDASMI